MRTTSIDTPADVGTQLDVDVSALFRPAFPSADLVSAAAGLLTPLRPWDGSEGARARLIIGPGMVAVGRVDPVRAERASDRVRESAWKGAVIASSDYLLEERQADAVDDLQTVNVLADAGLVPWSTVERHAGWLDHLDGRIEKRDDETDSPPARAAVTVWSGRSRARMVRRLAELDYAPLFAAGRLPAMLTLTYPGDWETVAATPNTCKRHVDAFKKRFERTWGEPLVGVWKREFQRRGAPHYHVLMTPPHGEVLDGGERIGFRVWASRAWAEVVGHPDAEQRRRHALAGTAVDYAEGMRARDPKRLAVYFSKHGSFSAKDYQNHAPDRWVDAGSVGRFWGVWGLDVATATVEVTPVEALAAARTMRRWQRANGYRVQREVWRTDTRTGEQRKRRSGVWSGARMRGSAGFVVVNDGAAFGSALASYLDQVRERAQAAEVERWLTSPARLARLDVESTATADHRRTDRSPLIHVPAWTPADGWEGSRPATCACGYCQASAPGVLTGP